MIKVLFLIRSLDTGGAERQLVELVKNLDKTRFEALVVTFYAGGNLPNELISLPGVTLYSLGKNGRWNNLAFIRKLIQLIRAQQPDLIHSYLDVANLFALLVGKITHLPVVWGVRASKMALDDYDWTARLSYWLTVLFSGLADWIIINSNAGKEHHVQNGYFSKKITVIPNGIDVDRCQQHSHKKNPLREEWQKAQDRIIVGMVGRLDPTKDYPNFLRSAAQIINKRKDVKFVCVGAGMEEYRHELVQLSDQLGLQDHLIWAGLHTNMEAVYNALDILVLSSKGEGFPNVIGEAMACAVPVVATDVGDVSYLVGETGIVVKPGDSDALASGILKLLEMSADERFQWGQRARQRVESMFSVKKMVESTQDIFINLSRQGEKSKRV